MWTRADLKTNAKAFYKKFFFKALLVSFVLVIVGGGNGSGGSSGGSSNRNNWFNNNSNRQIMQEFNTDFSAYPGAFEFSNEASDGFFEEIGSVLFSPAVAGFIAIGIGIFLVVLIFFFAFRVFLGYPIEVGARRFFVRGAESDDDVELSYLTSGFSGESYFNVVITMLKRAVITFLFYLLLIIPGIIKSYAYAMVPYILADNPNMDSKEALKLSERMTDGQKWDMFVLDLSFIGWYLLGSLLFGLGIFFVNPYVDATKAQLYLVLRENAVKTQLCSAGDLGLSTADFESQDDSWYNYES